MKQKCKICSGEEISLFHDTVRKGSEILFGNILKCESCGVIFLESRPSQGDLNRFYGGGEYRKQFFPERDNALSAESSKYHDLKEPLQKLRYDKVKDLFFADCSVLEIGCATGGFLDLLKEWTSQLRGLELYRPHAQYARKVLGLQVYELPLEEYQGKDFDIILHFHVLEHVEDPVAFLKKTRSHLRENGLTIIEVPCVDDPLISVYGVANFKRFYFQAPHLYYFSEGSLGFAMRAAGFSKIAFRSYQVYGITNHMSWIYTGASGDKTRASGSLPRLPEAYVDHSKVHEWLPLLEMLNGEYKAYMERNKKADTLLCIGFK